MNKNILNCDVCKPFEVGVCHIRLKSSLIKSNIMIAKRIFRTRLSKIRHRNAKYLSMSLR